MPRIDLHTHSSASDGLLAPADLIGRAAAEGLDVIALTDHDTTRGIAAAAGALPAGLTLIPGAEISCGLFVEPGRWMSLHILAYLFDATEPTFAAARAAIRGGRDDRARAMVDALAADGHAVSWDQVRRLADGVVGRPHVAAALVEAGLIASVAEAFTPDWIGTRGRYWVGKSEPDVLATIQMIAEAGGVSVFAHPFASARGEIVGPEVIATMAAAGLTGLEVDHPDHQPEERAHLRDLAAEYHLIVTGSSDFHGATKPQRLGAETTDADQYGALIAAATGAVPITAPGRS
ncbi:MAG: PHP domain-containing protein [Frankia sp.]